MFSFDEKLLLMDPVAVVGSMQSRLYNPERFDTLDSYMEYQARAFWRLYGSSITIVGESLEDRCRSFVDQLIDLEFLKAAE